MTTRISRRAVVRLVAAGATIFSIGCANNPLEPTNRNMRANAARHDDDPGPQPTDPCKSGWTVTNGRWTCDDI